MILTNQKKLAHECNECEVCGGEVINDGSFYVCISCGNCSGEPVLESKRFDYNEPNWQRENRIVDNSPTRAKPYRKSIMIYSDIHEELMNFLKGKDIKQIRFVSDAISKVIDFEKTKLKNSAIIKRILEVYDER